MSTAIYLAVGGSAFGMSGSVNRYDEWLVFADNCYVKIDMIDYSVYGGLRMISVGYMYLTTDEVNEYLATQTAESNQAQESLNNDF